MVSPRLTIRPTHSASRQALEADGVHPLLARLWAGRGITHPDQTRLDWSSLLPPDELTQCREAACVLADAIEQQQKILIVADYDCDGATACAVALRALREMGAQVDFLVPNRFETGYGLSPAVVELACHHRSGKPHIILTVDNGIASIDGVQAARAVNIGVVITDHHLPTDQVPQALAIVNPNQAGCGFLSKNLAGVGVAFYTMLALRAELRRRGVFAPNGGPRLDALADLVALGTIADVVKLDNNNRLLVAQGLKRIRMGKMQPGLRALFAVAGRSPRSASSFDLGYIIGPRINAAGRLADMSLGIVCLTTDDENQALETARELDLINRERRQIESSMREQAFSTLASTETPLGASVCVYDANWHQGIVGLVASRLKEKYWRPTLAFAPASNGELRGSGRSIPDVHLRDVLDLISKRHPHLIQKFGGHAMAAGLSLLSDHFDAFVPAFDQAVRELSGRDHFEAVIETDGSLESGYANTEVAGMLQQQVWGAGFNAPLFLDTFQVYSQRIVGEKHLKLLLQRGHQRFEAIWFDQTQSLPLVMDVAYRIEQNHWNGVTSIQLVIEHAMF